jgi:hypothetical protein
LLLTVTEGNTSHVERVIVFAVSMSLLLFFTCAVMSCLLVTGCTKSTGQEATVHGLLVWPDRSMPQRLSAAPTAGTVLVFRGARRVAEVLVGRSGHFTVHLPPGTYVLRGMPRRFTPSEASCAAARSVHMGNGHNVTIEVDCHYRGIAPA